MKASNLEAYLQTALAEEPVIATPHELEQSFRAHHGMVFRTAYRITGNAADAEDVLQTVFLRLLRRASGARSPENEESYLRRAAINASLDVLRAQRTTPRAELDELPSSSNRDSLEFRQALARALARLKPRSAEVFALRFLEGFDNACIAEMLGISRMLVAVIAHRARQQLRKELGSYLGDRS